MTTETTGPQSGPRKRRKIDWLAIRRDYMLGQWTLRELEERHKVPAADICRRAKGENWPKDLMEVTKLVTTTMVMEEVTKEAMEEVRRQARASSEEATDMLVRTYANANKQVILEHRKRFAKAGEVAMGLLGELAMGAMLAEHRDVLVGLLAGEEPDAAQLQRAREGLSRALSLPSRAGSMAKITDSLIKLAEAERKNLGLDTPEPPKANETPPFSTIPPEKRMDAVMGLLRG